jgi:ribonuclease E
MSDFEERNAAQPADRDDARRELEPQQRVSMEAMEANEIVPPVGTDVPMGDAPEPMEPVRAEAAGESGEPQPGVPAVGALDDAAGPDASSGAPRRPRRRRGGRGRGGKRRAGDGGKGGEPIAGPGASSPAAEQGGDGPGTPAEAPSGMARAVPAQPQVEARNELDLDTAAELELAAAEAAAMGASQEASFLRDDALGGPPASGTTPPVTAEAPERRGRRRRRRGRGRGRGRGIAAQVQQGQQPGPAQSSQVRAEAVPAGDSPAPTQEPARPQPSPGQHPQPPVRPAAAEEEGQVEPPPTDKIMLVNAAQPDECRIAILEEGRLQELYVERTAALSHVGNVYKGVVTNVEPSIQAAFIDFGQGKNGFLHISDLQPQYFPGGGEAEDVGRKTPRRQRPLIQKCLRRNQEIVVQVTKEGIGTKGATLTTYVALPGRYLVMMPGMTRLGVSRKIEDEEARRRMRDVLNELELPGDMGFILRTAGLDRTKRELQRDLNYLVRLWKQILKRKAEIKAPAELYRESDLVTRTLRDVVTTDVKEILIDSEPVAASARQFLRLLSPRLSERVKFYNDAQPLFFKYGVEDEIARIYSKRVPLRSGGYLVIESTEALVAIDVNSGKFRQTPDPEESAFRINLEAVDEIARQLSLRDLGGVIICDFIDMHMERHRREIERALREALKKHKERAEILRMSRFGIIEMTRQRQRAGIVRSMLMDCPHCGGGGLVKSPETVVLETLRAIQAAATHPEVARIEVRVSLPVAQTLLNNKRQALAELESKAKRTIVVVPSTEGPANQIVVTCTDARGWPVQVPLPKSLMNGSGSA